MVTTCNSLDMGHWLQLTPKQANETKTFRVQMYQQSLAESHDVTCISMNIYKLICTVHYASYFVNRFLVVPNFESSPRAEEAHKTARCGGTGGGKDSNIWRVVLCCTDWNQDEVYTVHYFQTTPNIYIYMCFLFCFKPSV